MSYRQISESEYNDWTGPTSSDMETKMEKLTPSQLRKLKHIAEGETRNPGNLSTTYSLVVRGLVEAEKGGKFPHLYMTYRITDKGRKALSED